jgi:hypothetical protein
MRASSLPTRLFLFSTLLVAAECGGGSTANNTSTLQGHVSVADGTQAQSLKILSGTFGGSGSVSAAVKVRVSTLGADGSLSVVAEASVQAGGSYSIAVPAGIKRMVAECVDASGNVVASAIVEASGAVGETVTVTPMDTESSVEALVMAKMAANGVALADINAIDLRARISRNVALAVKAATDADVKIKALAEAIAAAQIAKIKGYASVGVTTTQSALFDAELAAAKKLDAALDAAAGVSASADQAYASFYGDLTASLMALDSNARKHARVESIASVAFRAVIKARLSVSGDAVADASLRAAASAEARLSAAVVDSILAAGGAAADVSAAAKTAEASLFSQLSASASATASTAAFASWNVALNGGGTVTGSVLGTYLGVNTTTAVAVQGSVTAITNAAATLDTALKTAAGALGAAGAIDFNVVAQSVVTAYTAFQTTVDAQAAALVGFGTKAQVALDVMATASGSFRLQ